MSDRDSIILLITQFYKESLSEYYLSLDWDTLKTTVETFIKNHITLVAENKGEIIGIIAGYISPSIFDSKQSIAQESMWYITKSYRHNILGLRLFKAFEKECKCRGAKLIYMIYMDNLNKEIMDRLYKINGYKLMEYHCVKEVR